jgi:RNA polymerase sigma factor (sigma-70 family)
LDSGERLLLAVVTLERAFAGRFLTASSKFTRSSEFVRAGQGFRRFRLYEHKGNNCGMSTLLQPARSDEQLVCAIAAGDRDAFDELYRRYARPLANYGGRVLRNHSRGEDVAQTALTRAYEALQRGTTPLRVKPWLYKIALNTALEQQREEDGEVLDSECELHEDVASDAGRERADILAAVQVLPERQRMAFFLREVQGLSVNDVASRLNLDNQQVEQALFAARNRLAEELVFGRRVDCDLVRSLDAQALTRFERRALKSHLRGCPSCKANAGAGFSSIVFWLRDAWQWLGGGGAGAAASTAKLGALAVTAAALGTAPMTLPVIVHGIVHHPSRWSATAATTAGSRPDADATSSLARLQRLNALFVPVFARPLVPAFDAPSPPDQTVSDAPNPTNTAPSVAPPSDTVPAETTQPPTDSTARDTIPAPDPTPADLTPSSDPNAAPVDPAATDPVVTDAAPDPTSTDSTPTDTTPTDTATTDTTPTGPTLTDTTSTIPDPTPTP